MVGKLFFASSISVRVLAKTSSSGVSVLDQSSLGSSLSFRSSMIMNGAFSTLDRLLFGSSLSLRGRCVGSSLSIFGRLRGGCSIFVLDSYVLGSVILMYHVKLLATLRVGFHLIAQHIVCAWGAQHGLVTRFCS